MKDKKPKLIVDPPALPCDECIEIHGKIFDNEVVSVFCEHNSVMALYIVGREKWVILNQVSKEEYERFLQRAEERVIDILNNLQNPLWN